MEVKGCESWSAKGETGRIHRGVTLSVLRRKENTEFTRSLSKRSSEGHYGTKRNQVNSSQRYEITKKGIKTNNKCHYLLVGGIQDELTTQADILKSWPSHKLLLKMLEWWAHSVCFKMYLQYKKCKIITGQVWKQERKSSYKSKHPDENGTTQP